MVSRDSSPPPPQDCSLSQWLCDWQRKRPSFSLPEYGGRGRGQPASRLTGSRMFPEHTGAKAGRLKRKEYGNVGSCSHGCSRRCSHGCSLRFARMLSRMLALWDDGEQPGCLGAAWVPRARGPAAGRERRHEMNEQEPGVHCWPPWGSAREACCTRWNVGSGKRAVPYC